MKLTWKALNNNKVEVGLVIAVIIAAGIISMIKPISPVTLSYFADTATIFLLGLAILLVVVGARRRVV